jgi:hypothetical protein
VARALSKEELDVAGTSSWQELMPEITKMVAQMRERGEVEVLQRGAVLSGDLGEGPKEVKGKKSGLTDHQLEYVARINDCKF